MFAYPLRTAALSVAAAVGLSACTTGYGYGPYGGSSVSVGIGSGYYDPYYGYGYDIPVYHYGAGYPYYGWYDGFYYPGTGYYVYDRYRRPHRWTDRHRRYWEQRRQRSLADGFRQIATNWSDFDRSQATSSTRQVSRSLDRPTRVERRIDRPSRVERSKARSERRAARVERQSARQEQRSESRSQRESRSNARSRDNNREE